MRIYLTDEYIEKYKNYAGYSKECNLIMLMSKHVDNARKKLFVDMFKQIKIDDLNMVLAMEENGFPLDVHFSSENGFEYAKFKPELIGEFLDTLIMYVNLDSNNSIHLMFEELGPIFTMVSPSILCKEFGNAIAFMIGEGVVDLEFNTKDDDLNDDFAKNLINKTKEEQMQFIYSYCDKEMQKDDKVS